MEIFSVAPIVQPEITVIGKMRGFVRFSFQHAGDDIVMFATHTYPPLALGAEGFRWRNEQLVALMPREINRFSNVPAVVVGDLNTTMWSPAYRKLIHATGLRNARDGFGICPTLGSERRWIAALALPYDHSLVNQKVGVIGFRSGPFLGSDHLPIIAELAVVR
jgi:endonuclease/exonuclease/phosphatase (EEP) superfamily protein YafD